LKYFFRNRIEKFAMPNAQKVWRLLRYALTCTPDTIQNLAQRGLSRRPSDSMRSMEGETSQYSVFLIISKTFPIFLANTPKQNRFIAPYKRIMAGIKKFW